MQQRSSQTAFLMLSEVSVDSPRYLLDNALHCVPNPQRLCLKSGLTIDVIHGNLRCYRTVHIEDDLPGLSVDAVQFPGKLCIQLQNLKLSD